MTNRFIPLPSDRYNTHARNLSASQLTSEFNKMMYSIEFQGIDFDFYIDPFVFNQIKVLPFFPEKNTILEAFRIYCTNSSYKKMTFGFLEVTISYKDPSRPKDRVFLGEIVLNSIMYHNLATDFSKLECVISDIQSKIKRTADLIPKRESAQDGQMKIMVDAVLAVDSLESLKDQKVCIVGSSHQVTVQPRYAYGPIMHMLEDSVVEMYDFIEEEGKTKEGSNVVVRHAEGVNYSSLKAYDLVIDDVWENGHTSLTGSYMSDKTIDEVYPDNFSLKSFGERSEEGNIYKQCCHTLSREQRVVSRPVVPLYKDHDMLGDCTYCVELKFFLRRSYDIPFYKSIMMAHKKPCSVPLLDKVVDVISAKSEAVADLRWKEVLTPSFHTSDEIARRGQDRDKRFPVINVDFDKLRQHPSDNLEFDVIELRSELLTLVDVVVSSNYFVTQMIYESAKNVYKIEDRHFFILERPYRGVALKEPLNDFNESLSHRGYWVEENGNHKKDTMAETKERGWRRKQKEK